MHKALCTSSNIVTFVWWKLSQLPRKMQLVLLFSLLSSISPPSWNYKLILQHFMFFVMTWAEKDEMLSYIKNISHLFCVHVCCGEMQKSLRPLSFTENTLSSWIIQPLHIHLLPEVVTEFWNGTCRPRKRDAKWTKSSVPYLSHLSETTCVRNMKTHLNTTYLTAYFSLFAYLDGEVNFNRTSAANTFLIQHTLAKWSYNFKTYTVFADI